MSVIALNRIAEALERIADSLEVQQAADFWPKVPATSAMALGTRIFDETYRTIKTVSGAKGERIGELVALTLRFDDGTYLSGMAHDFWVKAEPVKP